MKKRNLLIALILIIILSFGLMTVACRETVIDKPTPPTPTAPTKLGNVELEYNSAKNVIRWKIVDNAKTFNVTLAITKGDTETVLDKKDISSQQYSMSAYGEGNYKFSAYAVGHDNFTNGDSAVILVTIPPLIPRPDPLPDGDTPGNIYEDDLVKDVVGSLTNIRLKNGEYSIRDNILSIRGEDKDCIIAYPKTSTIHSVDSYALDKNMYKIDNSTQQLVIYHNFFNMFSVGAKIQLNIVMDNGAQLKTFVSVVPQRPYELQGNAGEKEDHLIYTQNSSAILFGVKGVASDIQKIVYAVAIDGNRISPNYISFKTPNIISLANNKETTQMLTAGLHTLQVFTEKGTSEVPLFVKVMSSLKPINVNVDIDSVFGKAIVRWQMPTSASAKFAVIVNDVVYDDIAFKDKFDGMSFDATGLVKYGDKIEIKASADTITSTSNAITFDINTADIGESDIRNSFLNYNKTFEIFGRTNNFYISSKSELKDLFDYMLMRYDLLVTPGKPINNEPSKMVKFYYNLPKEDGTIPTIEGLISSFAATSAEPVVIDYIIEKEGEHVYSISFISRASFVAKISRVSTDFVEVSSNDIHYGTGARSLNFNDFAVNKINKTTEVYGTYELYMALERGLRPIPFAGSAAERIYNKAKDVLRTIIDDSMNDFQKVHAIYDWLAVNVVYDYKLIDEMANIKIDSPEYHQLYGYNVFFPEGVFDDHVAVCNGIAAAFSMMCNIEGIECYKVVGSVDTYISFGKVDRVAHAWVKTYIGGSWYISDPTWANRKDDKTKTESLNHKYLLMNNAESKPNSDHVENSTGRSSTYYKYAGDNFYSIYANILGDVHYINGIEYISDSVIDSQQKADFFMEWTMKKYSFLKAGDNKTIGVYCTKAMWDIYYPTTKAELAQNGFHMSLIVEDPTDNNKITFRLTKIVN